LTVLSKERVYVEFFLSTPLTSLLHGSKTWCFREDLFNRLRHFHQRCTRIMCRITIAYSIRHRVSSASLIKRLAIEPFDTFYNRRLLRLTGHVARMPFTRTQINLTCCVDNPRSRGCPQMNWGRTLKKALLSYNFPTRFVKCREIAADRNQWSSVCGSKMPSEPKRRRPPPDKASGLKSGTALSPHKYKNLHGNSRWTNEMNEEKEKHMQSDQPSWKRWEGRS
jgi:hypothetical protein